jgi:multisubunit Na+/H+ antiporter MnhF subunit
VINEISLTVLGLAAVLFAWRLYRGPTLADRANALNGMLSAGIAAIAVLAIETGNSAYLPVIVVITLVGFVGSAMVARYIEGRSRR